MEPSQAKDGLSRVIGLVAFAALIIWAVSSRSNIDTFLDAECFAIAVLGPVALLFASYGWTAAKAAFGLLVGWSKPAQEVQTAVDFFRTGAAFALACGFLGAIIGFVIMLSNLADPRMVGPAIATTLLTQLYGTLLATLFLVFSIRLARHQAVFEVDKKANSFGQGVLLVGGPATVAGVLSVVACFLVLLLTFLLMPC